MCFKPPFRKKIRCSTPPGPKPSEATNGSYQTVAYLEAAKLLDTVEVLSRAADGWSSEGYVIRLYQQDAIAGVLEF